MLSRIIVLICLLISVSLNAQEQKLRKVIEDSSFLGNSVVSLGNKGVIVYGIEKVAGQNNRILHLSFHNPKLEPIKSFAVKTFKNSDFFEVLTNDNKDIAYFYRQNNSKKVLLCSFDANTEKMESKVIKLNQSFKPDKILELNGQLILSGKSKAKLAFLIMDQKSAEQKLITLPGNISSKAQLSFTKNKEGNSISILFQKLNTLFLTELKTDGTLTKPLQIDLDKNHFIKSGDIVWVNKTDFMLSGTYGLSNSKQATGMYLSKWTNGSQRFCNYYPFSDFANFYSYLLPNLQREKQEAVDKAKKRGDQNSIKVFTIMHPVCLLDSSYVMVGEVYIRTAESTTTTRGIPGPGSGVTGMGDDWQSTRKELVYTHAVILGTSLDGKQIYDYCFRMGLSTIVLTPDLNLNLMPKRDKLQMALFYDNEFVATIADKDTILKATGLDIRTGIDGDKIESAGGMCDYWYDGQYVAVCHQTIINKTNQAIERRRKVLIITKIAYPSR